MKRGSQTAAWVLWALLLAVAWPAGAHAQAVTTAAISGRVTNQQGAPVPGARVSATNVANGAVGRVVTRQDGRYLLPGLQPGTYRVTVGGLGFADVVRSNVALPLGTTVPLDVQLSTQALALEAISVTADRGSVISPSHTGASSTVSDSTLRRLPTITRDIADFTRLVPQLAVTNSTTGAVSAGGRNNRYNQLQIDGTASNDLFGLSGSGTPSGQAGAKAITLEAVQELQVVLAPFDVRQNGFTGAGVNAVTKSGTNRIQGTISGFTRNQDLAGRFLTTADTLSSKLDTYKNQEFAGSLGGPILRDKAFFFVAAEHTSRTNPTNYVAGTDPAFGITQSQAQQVATFLNGLGYDPGGVSARSVNRGSTNLFGRLDFNLGQNNRLTLRHNYIDGSREDFSSSASTYYLSNAGYTQLSTTNSSVLQLNSGFGGGIFNELRLGYNRVRDHREFPGDPFPRVQVNGFGSRSVVAGTENSSTQNVLNQDAFEFTNDLTIPMGAHTFTVGTSNEFSKFANLFVQNTFGNYTFADSAALAAGKPNRYQYQYLLPGGNPQAEFNVRRYSAYGEDRWDAGDNFQLTIGARVEHFGLPHQPAQNDTVLKYYNRSTASVPKSITLWNPRLGFNWDVTGDRSTQLRGGLGLFSGRNPAVWIANAYGKTGLDYLSFTCTTAATAPAFVADPTKQPKQCVGATNATLNEIDLINPNFRTPQVARYNLAIDRQLPFGLVGTAEALYTATIHDLLYQNLGIVRTGATVENRAGYRLRTDVPGIGNVIDVRETKRGYAYNLTAQVQRPFRGNWDASLAYTFSRAKDLNPLGSSTAFSQWSFNQASDDPNNPGLHTSDNDIPHRIVATTSRRFNIVPRAATDVSLVYIGQSGQPYSYRYNGDVNGDGSTGNDLVYVPMSQADVKFSSTSAISAAQSWQNLNAFIESTPCLREARGKIVGRNACRTPWNNRIDFRIAQNLSTFHAQNAQFTLDVLNFANLLNSNWGASRFIANQTDNLLSLNTGVATDANGRKTFNAFTVRTDKFVTSSTDSRYQIQLGLRYSF
ncbi:MAG: TonB-dependent outer rane receptor precursor [Gemmatimonadetes bacterium]|nr:TonB-dependent outer rane receptor precursor [Gemmatimonadota bacterium]